MDYRELFAHLIEHMIRVAPEDCEYDCRVAHPEDGGIETSELAGQNSRRTLKLLDAMCAVGLAARVETYQPSRGYFPTAEGIAYLEKYKSPSKFWLKQNWFAVFVALMTIAVPIVLKTVDILFS